MKSLLLLALIPSVALAQKAPAGCPLLTQAEITAAIGQKAGEAHETDMLVPDANGKKQTMTGCMWRVGDKGMVNVAVMPAVGTKAQHDAGLAKIRQTYEMLKAKGWTTSESRIGNMLCNTAVPPKAQAAGTPAMVGCFAEAKGFIFSIGYMAPNANVPPAKVKALADSAVKRLP